MEPMRPFEFAADLDSVEGEVLDGSVSSAAAWALVMSDLRDWLIRQN